MTNQTTEATVAAETKTAVEAVIRDVRAAGWGAMQSLGLTREEIKGLLCCGFEGGSNYWASIASVVWPSGRPQASYAEGGSSQDEDYWHWSALVPLDGGAIMIALESGAIMPAAHTQGDCDGLYCLDGDALARGTRLLAAKYTYHWNNARTGNADADTGDVFLQLCLFGDVVFG